MIDEDCEECGGEGYFEIQTAVDDFKRVPCECSYPNEDEEYERWKDNNMEDEKREKSNGN